MKYINVNLFYHFLNLKSRKVWLRNDTTGESFSVSFDGADYLLLWTKYKAKYICIEPWFGLADYDDFEGELPEKDGIEMLPANGVFNCAFSVKVL